MEWFKVGKKLFFKSINETKDKLKTRIRKEQIDKKQYNKLIKNWDTGVVNDESISKSSAACVKLFDWVKAMKQI